MHEDASACFQPDPGADQYARLEQGIKEGWQPLLQRGLAHGGAMEPTPRSSRPFSPPVQTRMAT